MLSTLSPELLGQLAVLALIDSTSFGTLLIPLWLMLAPGRLRPGRVLMFLGTVATFYFALGLALLAGATALYARLGSWLDSPVAGYLQLALGVGLFAGSFFIGRKKKDDDGAASETKPGRLARWRARAMGVDDAGAGTEAGTEAATGPVGGAAAVGIADRRATARSSLLALMGLALGAALVESASMLPYLAAIGLMTGADLPVPTVGVLLAAYCLVMILPALLILGARIVAAGLIRRPLEKLEGWMTRSAAETTAWIVGILGFLLARDAIARTGILAELGVSVL